MLYSKRRKNLGRGRRKSSKRLHMRGGSSSSIQDCNVETFTKLLELLNTEFSWKNDRLDVRKAVNQTGCALADLKKEYMPWKLYSFGFSIRELIDSGFSIDKLLNAGLDEDDDEDNDDKQFKIKEYDTLTVNEKEYADMLQEKMKQQLLKKEAAWMLRYEGKAPVEDEEEEDEGVAEAREIS
jgi:hypothetical protein